jgi:hypothetical protein
MGHGQLWLKVEICCLRACAMCPYILIQLIQWRASGGQVWCLLSSAQYQCICEHLYQEAQQY